MNIFNAPFIFCAVLVTIIMFFEVVKTFKRPDERIGLYKTKRKYAIVISIIPLLIGYVMLGVTIWMLWTR